MFGTIGFNPTDSIVGDPEVNVTQVRNAVFEAFPKIAPKCPCQTMIQWKHDYYML